MLRIESSSRGAIQRWVLGGRWGRPLLWRRARLSFRLRSEIRASRWLGPRKYRKRWYWGNLRPWRVIWSFHWIPGGQLRSTQLQQFVSHSEDWIVQSTSIENSAEAWRGWRWLPFILWRVAIFQSSSWASQGTHYSLGGSHRYDNWTRRELWCLFDQGKLSWCDSRWLKGEI